MKFLHRWVFVTLSLLLVAAFATTAHAATFPITQDFSGAQPADWELRSAGSWNTFVSGDQTLRLTTAAGSQSGLGFYNDAFSSDLGIVAEFRYFAGGGTGADGLAFFLVDGDLVDENNIAAGAFGAGLGYAQSNQPANGIPHAYLGVGFDEFGNFVTSSGGMDQGSADPVPDSVVLRGSGNGTTGYEYLMHRDVIGDLGLSIDGGWRIARVTVVPSAEDATVRVEMSWDEGETWHTIIDDYVYDEVPPENLKLGFTAGTGGSTNIHAVGNLEVNLPVDLETTLTVAPSGTYERGDTITYTYTVENHGPNDSAGTIISNSLPLGALGVEDITWSLTSTHGSSTSGDGSDFDEITIAIPAGETVTVSATGTIGSEILDTTNLDHTIAAAPGVGETDPSPGDAAVTVTITTDAPTAEESALLKILAYAASGGTTTAPTVDDYDTAGVNGVSEATLDDVNEMVRESGATNLEELQDVIDVAVTPAVETLAATGVTRTSAQLNGAVLRLGDEDIANALFEYGQTTAYGSELTLAKSTAGTYMLEAIDLACDTTYHFRAVIENDDGDPWYGEDQSFTTEGCASSGSTATRSTARAEAKLESTTPGSVAARITAMKAQIAALQATLQQLRGQTGGNSPDTVATVTVRDLYSGLSGEDVRLLQQLLVSIDTGPAAKELAGVSATGFFSTYTKNALSEYQQRHGIVPAEGYFGPITRAQMKSAGLPGLWW